MARKDEMKEVHEPEVYCKVAIKECWDKPGKASIKIELCAYTKETDHGQQLSAWEVHARMHEGV